MTKTKRNAKKSDKAERKIDRAPELYTVYQAATLLQCSVGSIRSWITQGTLPCRRIGRLVRIRRADLEAFVEAGAQPHA